MNISVLVRHDGLRLLLFHCCPRNGNTPSALARHRPEILFTDDSYYEWSGGLHWNVDL